MLIAEPKHPVSEAEKARRQEAAEFARVSVGLEGFVSPPEARAIIDRHTNGEIDLDEMIALTLKLVDE